MRLEELVRLAERQLNGSNDGGVEYIRPHRDLGVLRQRRKTTLEATIYEPVLILVLRGAKENVLGTQSLGLNAGDCLLVSHDLPVVTRITEAPYLALVVELDLMLVREIQAALEESAPSTEARGLAVEECAPVLLDALGRYLTLADSAADARILGPSIRREIHYRITQAPFGGMLRELIRKESQAGAVAKAIAKLRGEFRTSVEVPRLARSVGMSAPAFHKHFKAITGTSPLQYRKALQLLEARRLLRTGAASVSAVAYEVGYESPSQFSRDYKRKFGVSPKRDSGR